MFQRGSTQIAMWRRPSSRAQHWLHTALQKNANGIETTAEDEIRRELVHHHQRTDTALVRLAVDLAAYHRETLDALGVRVCHDEVRGVRDQDLCGSGIDGTRHFVSETVEVDCRLSSQSSLIDDLRAHHFQTKTSIGNLITAIAAYRLELARVKERGMTRVSEETVDKSKAKLDLGMPYDESVADESTINEKDIPDKKESSEEEDDEAAVEQQPAPVQYGTG